MAIDNLNYYSSGLPAGQQTDKYSSQPGCLKSKNLDIFSSSKSVKATAWTAPTATGGGDIVDQDEFGNVQLKTDGKIYEDGVEILDPASNFPVRQVCYTGKNGTYANAQRGTPKRMLVKYDGDDWKSLVVYTDRSAYYYNKTAYVVDKQIYATRQYRDVPETRGTDDYFWITHNGGGGAPSSTWVGFIVRGNNEFSTVPIRLKCDREGDRITWDAAISGVKKVRKYYYDAELDGMIPTDTDTPLGDLVTYTGTLRDGLIINLPVISEDVYWQITIRDNSGGTHSGSSFGVDANFPNNWSPNNNLKDGDFSEYYSYLPIDENRNFIEVGEYYWMPAQTFQVLWEWNSSWEDANGQKQIRWEFQQYMGWNNPTEMTVIGLISWNEQIYMIGNMHGNGYIFPCDLTGGRGTPYIAYGCTFLGVTNIDYLLYLVGEDRGISTLWVFNQQELVPIVGGNKEKTYNDIIDIDEQYKFDGKIANWRKNLILSTSDNRIFQYGQTYGGKGGSFINELPDNAVIKELKASGNDLKVVYTITVNDTTTEYTVTYQDDTPIKNYKTEWGAVYPIVLGNHLLEKEESDLFASYIIPDSTSKLEFWASANHYHFWTFKTDGNTVPTVGSLWDIDGVTNVGMFSTSRLEFVENNSGWLTFRLVGDMPVMSGLESNRLVFRGKNVQNYISYTEVNHFRKIGEITASKFEEGEFRFTNLNNKLELPKSHSLQVKVIGKGTVNFTPELFSLDLVANQRDRG